MNTTPNPGCTRRLGSLQKVASRVVLAGGAAIAVAALAGCSSNNSSPAGSSSGPSAVKVRVDGQDQNVSGAVQCIIGGGYFTILVGRPGGIGAVMTDANPPVVQSVGLGTVNGLNFVLAGALARGGNAQVTKNGKSYTITGTANGYDDNNPSLQPVAKPFEMDATCP
jgi:lipoprotein LpqH